MLTVFLKHSFKSIQTGSGPFKATCNLALPLSVFCALRKHRCYNLAMRVERLINTSIRKAAEEMGFPEVGFVVEHPTLETMGDWATNVALIAKEEGKNPREVAELIVKLLEQDEELMDVVEKIEIAGPGFINFWLKKEYLLKELREVVKKKGDYGKGDWGKGRRMLIDYSAPNIAKRFGVGHLRSTIIGQALYNLYRFSGWECIGDNHLGDWGTQFGMIVVAIEMKGLDAEKLSVEDLESLYVEFNEMIKEKPELKDDAREAFARLERGDSKARQIWETVTSTSMREFARIYDMLKVKIDYAFGESTYEKLMVDVIKDAEEKGVSRLSQGAVIIEYDNLPPAMLVKSNGTTTYLTRDFATVKFRQSQDQLRSDRYIYEVGQEQGLHFQQVFAAARKLGYVASEELVHVGHGLVLGEDRKKLSTRKGTAIKLEEWLVEMIGKAGQINKESAEAVGIGAVKFFDLKHNPLSSYVFDMDEALKLEGNSGPYVQYAHARIKSMLSKAGVDKLSEGGIPEGEINREEMAVLRWICRFGEVVQAAAEEYAPNLVCGYLLELAGRFNGFYNQHQVIGGDNEQFRLVLAAGVGQVLENGMKLLGIDPVERM